jgi:hypothetical protein
MAYFHVHPVIVAVFRHDKSREISGSDSSEDIDVGLRGFNAMWTCAQEKLCVDNVSTKRWYLPTSPQGVKTQKTNINTIKFQLIIRLAERTDINFDFTKLSLFSCCQGTKYPSFWLARLL